jgi:alpha-amylase
MKFLLLCTFVGLIAAQHDPYWWPNRSGIVHLFTWKYSDIADECENFLAPRGYAGVQVSPAQEYIISNGRPWWERYQPISYRIFSRSGDENEFREMARRCNNVGIRIYVDIVINHMAAAGQGPVRGVGGSTADPDKLDFPNVPYSENDFNQPQCDIDPCWCNVESIRNCNLVGLTDLNLTRSNVRENAIAFLNKLIERGAAGFRVDAAKHMWPSDMQEIFPRLRDLNIASGFPPNSRPFLFQEVIDYGGEVISKFEYTQFGTVTEFKYAAELRSAFTGGYELKNLRTIGETWHHFLPSYQALTFIDNHDSQRGGNALTFRDTRLYKMATAFHLAWTYGVPRVMSSFHFDGHDQGPPMDENENIRTPIFNEDNSCGGGWVCEHRWRQIYNMIGFRNAVQGTNVEHWWDNGSNQIAFSRGNKGFIAFNGQFRVNMKMWLQTGLPAGVYCDVISGSKINDTCTGKSVQVFDDGKAEIKIGSEEEDGVLAIHVNARL